MLHLITSCRFAAPVLLSSQEEVMSFLQEGASPQPAGYRPDRVLGLFKAQTDAGTGGGWDSVCPLHMGHVVVVVSKVL